MLSNRLPWSQTASKRPRTTASKTTKIYKLMKNKRNSKRRRIRPRPRRQNSMKLRSKLKPPLPMSPSSQLFRRK
jgi:hypothetical protein